MSDSLVTIGDTLLRVLPDLLKNLSNLLQRGGPAPKQMEAQLAAVGNLLSGRLVYLLRYLDHTGDVRSPESYGPVLSGFREVGNPRPPASHSYDAEPAWEKAAQYACWYLSALGLVGSYGAVGGEIGITELGKNVIRSDFVRQRHRSAFDQQLPR
jgi:hypothetical protein